MKNIKNSGLFIIVAIAMGMYFGFQPLFTNTPDGVVRELLVASLGAIFVLFTTIIVLNHQTDSQIELKKSDKLFEKKIQVYSDAFDQIKKCIENEEFTEKDLIELRFIVHRLITFVGIESSKSMADILSFANKLLGESSDKKVDANNKLTPEQHNKFNSLLFEFDKKARKDIGTFTNEGDEEKLGEILQVLEDNIEAIEERKGRDTKKETFQNTKYTKKDYVFAVLESYIKSGGMSYEDFYKNSRVEDILLDIFKNNPNKAKKNFIGAYPFWLLHKEALEKKEKSSENNWQRYWLDKERILTFSSGEQIVIRNGQSWEDIEVFKQWCKHFKIPLE